MILDDVAGSGESLDDALTSAKSTGYPGEVVVSPMVSTEQAKGRFTGEPGKPGIVDRQSKVTFAPEQMARALEESDWFKSLPEAKRKRLRDLIQYSGYQKNALSMAFPYMAPDNNNGFFATAVAPEGDVPRAVDSGVAVTAIYSEMLASRKAC